MKDIEEEPSKDAQEKARQPNPLQKGKEKEDAKGAGPSAVEWVNGLLQSKNIQIPNDLDLQAAMKETEEDFNDFAQNLFFQTSLLLQESQKSQTNLSISYNGDSKLKFMSSITNINNRSTKQMKLCW